MALDNTAAKIQHPCPVGFGGSPLTEEVAMARKPTGAEKGSSWQQARRRPPAEALDAPALRIRYVAVMVGNRSFDQMHGYLSLEAEREDIDGPTVGMAERYRGRRSPLHHLQRTTLTGPDDPCRRKAA